MPAKVIYFIYSFFCHQFASRSIHLVDIQYAWCSRDTGIWLGVALAAWLIKYKKLRSIKWYWVIPFVVPIALDGGLQTIFTMLNLGSTAEGIPFYSSNNLVRFITGSIFGLGFSMWISGTFYADSKKSPASTADIDSSEGSDNNAVKQSSKSNSSKKSENQKNSFFIRNLIVAESLLIVLYIVMVAFWSFTSTKYLPTDTFDSVVKLQDNNFFERRANAPCPTEGVEDAFAIDCFLGR